MNRLVGHDLCRETIDWSGGDAVSDEVVGIPMIRERVVLGGEPVIETMIVRLRLPGQVESPVQVPLANVRGGVPDVLKQLGNGDLLGRYVHGREHRYPIAYPDAGGCAPSHQACAGR